MSEEKKLDKDINVSSKPTDEDIVMALCKQKQFLLEEQERTGNIPDTQLVYVTGEAVFEILDLIHRLQDENELLKQEKQLAYDTVKGYSLTDIEQKAEIERLTEENKKLTEENRVMEHNLDFHRNHKFELQKQVDELKEERQSLVTKLNQTDEAVDYWCDKFKAEKAEKDELTDKLGKVLSTVGIDEYQQSKAVEQAVKDTAKEIFEKIFEALCYFTTQGKSKEYTEGYIDCLAEIDKRLQNLAKEHYGVEVE